MDRKVVPKREVGAGVGSRYVICQYAAETWNKYAFSSILGWVCVRVLLTIAHLQTVRDFSVAFMHTPLDEKERVHVGPQRERVNVKNVVWKLREAFDVKRFFGLHGVSGFALLPSCRVLGFTLRTHGYPSTFLVGNNEERVWALPTCVQGLARPTDEMESKVHWVFSG